jgi:DNA polymerase-3 subunit chi
MTSIDFHSNAADRIGYTCRLVRKAHAAGSTLVIFSRDRQLLADLDQHLWTFSALDFLPHCYAHDALAGSTPILLTDVDQAAVSSADDLTGAAVKLASDTFDTPVSAPLPHHDVLVNLDSAVPAFFTRFTRLIEIVTATDQDRAAGRERWKFYKDRGYPLTHHDLAKGL